MSTTAMSSTAQAGAASIAERSAAGGPAGGGATQIIMPYLTRAIAKHVPEFEAWRWAFFVPGAMHLLVALFVMLLATVSLSLPPEVSLPPHASSRAPITAVCIWQRNNCARIHASGPPFVYLNI